MSGILVRARQQLAHIASQVIEAKSSTASRVPAQLQSKMSSVRSSSLYATSIFTLLTSLLAFYYLRQPLNSDSSQGTAQGEGRITDWVKPDDPSGEFKRQQSSFRDWISSDPNAQFPAEKGRYHLYVSYACPWGMASLRNVCGEMEWLMDHSTSGAHCSETKRP